MYFLPNFVVGLLSENLKSDWTLMAHSSPQELLMEPTIISISTRDEYSNMTAFQLSLTPSSCIGLRLRRTSSLQQNKTRAQKEDIGEKEMQE